MAHGPATISFLAGDTGLLPEIAGNPAGAAGPNGFLDGVQRGHPRRSSRDMRPQGSIVHYLDLTAMLGQINANPAAYGITKGLVCPIFPNSTCVVEFERLSLLR